MTSRRTFVHQLGLALLGGVFVPRFGRWFRPLASGLMVPEGFATVTGIDHKASTVTVDWFNNWRFPVVPYTDRVFALDTSRFRRFP